MVKHEKHKHMVVRVEAENARKQKERKESAILWALEAKGKVMN